WSQMVIKVVMNVKVLLCNGGTPSRNLPSTKGLLKKDTTFFMSNLPNLGGQGVLRKIFQSLDIYVPKKKSQNGRRFTFIRFLDAVNAKALESNLNSVWIDFHKLYVNIACFARSKVALNKIIPRKDKVVSGRIYQNLQHRNSFVLRHFA
ncbi:hypothetical protein Ancab_031870, partial [Ancistrocladus abbreviatus]